jgi:hypothetical protein
MADFRPTLPIRASRAATVGAVAAGLALATGLPASAAPATPPPDQRIYQAAPIPGQVEKFDFYGWGLAAGDFDGDGHDDLATSASDESLGGIAGAGAVIVIYGSGRGLRKADNQRFHQDTPGIPDHAEATDKFAERIAAGDFDGDGYDDLAIGVPAEDRGGLADVGIVQVLYGTRHGLRVRGTQLFSQASRGIQGKPETGDRFGDALAAGDVDGDGRDDLVVGTVGDAVSGVSGAGSVSVIFGSRSGLSRRDRLVTQDSKGVPDSAETGDAFGTAVAVGDLDGDGFDDIAVGTPNEAAGATLAVGAVHVFWGTGNALRNGPQLHQDDWPTQTNDEFDAFGRSVAIGRHLKGVGQTLLVGAPGEENDTGWAGQGHLVGNRVRHPADSDGPVQGWRYGDVVAVGRTRHNSMTFRSAPAANAPLGTVDLTGGAVFSRTIINQDTGPWSPVSGDGFGLALAPGDFDGDGWVDLAVGIPFKDVNGKQDAGAVSVYYDPRPFT